MSKTCEHSGVELMESKMTEAEQLFAAAFEQAFTKGASCAYEDCAEIMEGMVEKLPNDDFKKMIAPGLSTIAQGFRTKAKTAKYLFAKTQWGRQ